FHGRFVELAPCYAWPKPVQQPRVRTLIGGGASARLFAAIAEYADGWMPIGGSGLRVGLPALRAAVAAVGRDPGALHVVPFGTVPDDGKLEHFADLGVTEVVLRLPSGTDATMLRTLDAFCRYLSD
ncbi:MAG TPA: LLM class flavin-dependent oxidoreductase, partial [Acidimicrobiales bacterium]|nr:LLM class flavin-dependent oxidoreductase [Acidimicrobiales bacterium]